MRPPRPEIFSSWQTTLQRLGVPLAERMASELVEHPNQALTLRSGLMSLTRKERNCGGRWDFLRRLKHQIS